MGEILSKLREEFLGKSRPTARMTPLPNSRVPASFHHQMELFLALNFNKYLCDIHSACQALFRHFTNTGLFNPHNSPHIVPILLIHEEKFVTGPVCGGWEPTWASELQWLLCLQRFFRAGQSWQLWPGNLLVGFSDCLVANDKIVILKHT